MKIRENPQLSPRVLELLRIYRGFVKMQQNMICNDDLCITYQIENLGCYNKYCRKPIFILFLHYIYCIPTFLWQKLIKENHRAIKISTQHKENRICQNRTVCSNLTSANTYGTRKILPN